MKTIDMGWFKTEHELRLAHDRHAIFLYSDFVNHDGSPIIGEGMLNFPREASADVVIATDVRKRLERLRGKWLLDIATCKGPCSGGGPKPYRFVGHLGVAP
jgi:hypothetical protein